MKKKPCFMNDTLSQIINKHIPLEKKLDAVKSYFSGLDTRTLIVYYYYYNENGKKLTSDIFKDSIFSEKMLNLRNCEVTFNDILKILCDILNRRTKKTWDNIEIEK